MGGGASDLVPSYAPCEAFKFYESRACRGRLYVQSALHSNTGRNVSVIRFYAVRCNDSFFSANSAIAIHNIGLRTLGKGDQSTTFRYKHRANNTSLAAAKYFALPAELYGVRS